MSHPYPTADGVIERPTGPLALAPRHRGQGALEGGDVQAPPEPHGRGQVVDR